jgi:hypothetical protein
VLQLRRIGKAHQYFYSTAEVSGFPASTPCIPPRQSNGSRAFLDFRKVRLNHPFSHRMVAAGVLGASVAHGLPLQVARPLFPSDAAATTPSNRPKTCRRRFLVRRAQAYFRILTILHETKTGRPGFMKFCSRHLSLRTPGKPTLKAPMSVASFSLHSFRLPNHGVVRPSPGAHWPRHMLRITR